MTLSADDPRLGLQQRETRRYAFDRRGTELWTVLYRSWHEETRNGAEFAALAPVNYRDSVLGDTGWDLSIGDGLPGFSQFFHDGEPETRYLRFGGTREHIEPIVIVQEQHGIKPRMLPRLSEEFRLFHNLWADPSGKRLVKVNDDGSEEIAAEIEHSLVRVRTKYLRQFQAARQLDLLLFIDSVEYCSDLDPDADYSGLEDDITTEDHSFFLRVGCFDRKLGPFSRLNGKKILTPPAIDKCGVWPFDDAEEEYPQFVIGEDENGEQVRFTCDHNRLANYFGANPEAPHYLTPVFFRREVLQRYYEDPDRYAVEDGYLRCGGLWGLHIDNDQPQHVMVFLGDLGRDLPESERRYWLTFNVSPTGQMSRTVFNRSFLARPADPTAADLRFKYAYEHFGRGWQHQMGWPLFKPLHEGDAHVLARLRVPVNDAQPEFEAQVQGLAKLLIDSLNEERLASELGGTKKDEKGISKLERWLGDQGYPHVDRDVGFLRRLQRLRSRATAHRKGSDYEDLLRAEAVNADPREEVAEQLECALTMVAALEAHFGVVDDE